jgi:hypothetical protein
MVDVDGVNISLESISDERRVPGEAVAVAPTPGAVFAVLDD